MASNRLLIKNSTLAERTLAKECQMATGFISRFMGLMGRTQMGSEEALFFPRCNSVHMWFMRIPIDILFLKKISASEFAITSIHSSVRPWKALPLMDLKASDVVELQAGVAQSQSLKPGDLLCIG